MTMAVCYGHLRFLTLNFSIYTFFSEKHHGGETHNVDGMKEDDTGYNHRVKQIPEMALLFHDNGRLLRTPSIFNPEF